MARQFVNQRGIGLVELLVVMVIMGVIGMAMLSQYQTTQRTSATQDALAGMQQNLRIAMDRMAYDLRMAGFMVADNAVETAESSSFTVNTAAEPATVIRIAKKPLSGALAPYDSSELADYSTTEDIDASGTKITMTVDLPEMVSSFTSGNKVRIYTSSSREPVDNGRIFEITAITAGSTDYKGESDGTYNPPKMTLDGFLGTDSFSLPAGSLIVRQNGSCLPTAGEPNHIAFSVNGSGELVRTVNGSGNINCTGVIADGISEMKLTYILHQSSGATDVEHDPSVDGALDTDTKRANIKAIRVSLSGQVTTVEGVKTKNLTSLFMLRNKR